MNLAYHFYNEDCVAGARAYLDDNSVDLIITDPPFAIEGDKLHKHYNRKEVFVIKGYIEIPKEEYAVFSREWIHEAERVLRPGGSMAIVSGYTNLLDILNALRETCLREVNHIIWKYNFGVSTKSKFVSSHYHILFYTKPGGKRTFNTFSRYGSQEKSENNRSLLYRDLEDVWIINREYKPGEKKNKNELPSELLVKLIQYLSNPGDVVCDFFLGGFSTAKVAKALGRCAVGFELNAHSFNHHFSEVTEIEENEWIDKVKNGVDDTPAKAGAPWSEEDLERLRTRFHELRRSGLTKNKTIVILCKEFERGSWSIIKRLEAMGIKEDQDLILSLMH